MPDKRKRIVLISSKHVRAEVWEGDGWKEKILCFFSKYSHENRSMDVKKILENKRENALARSDVLIGGCHGTEPL